MVKLFFFIKPQFTNNNILEQVIVFINERNTQENRHMLLDTPHYFAINTDFFFFFTFF